MGPRGRQKPGLLLVVARGCRRDLPPCVQDSVSILFGKSIHVTIFSVSIRQSISHTVRQRSFSNVS